MPRLSRRRPAERASSDTYLAGADRTSSGGPTFARARMWAFVGGTVLASILPNLDGRVALILFTVFGAISQPLLARFARNHLDLAFAVFDVGVMVALTLIDPRLWFLGVLSVLSTSVWLGIRLPTRLFIGVAVLDLVFVATFGIQTSQDLWFETWVISASVMALYGWRGRMLRQSLIEVENDLQNSLTAAGAIVHYSDLGPGRVLWVQGDVEAVTGWDAATWTSADHRELLHPDDGTFWIENDAAREGESIERSARFRGPDGNYRWIRDHSTIVSNGRGGLAVRGFSINVDEIERAQAALRDQAKRDHLTSLPNRFELETRLAAIAPEPFALLILDMNRFKEINDTLGHATGDEVLCLLSDRLRGAARSDDYVFRLGGDEFALILPNETNPEGAMASARRVAEQCSKPYELDALTVAAPVSIGIAMSRPEHPTLPADILRQADIAMYSAKGRSLAAVVFSSELERVSIERLRLSAELPVALANSEFTLHFQPKIELATGKIVSVEGLARWEHPDLGLLLPADFLDLITLSNAYDEFTDVVVDHGAAFVAKARSCGHDLSVAVNVSVRSFHDPDFVHRLTTTMSKHGVDSRSLILEVTEAELHQGSGHSATVLASLGRAGIQLAIDDFGTGFSSLQRLRDLEADELKIDKSFVSALESSERDRHIVESIIELAGKLGLRVVAEGVERPEQMEILSALGCHTAQGFLFARPMSGADLLAMLDSRMLAGGQPL